MKKLQFSFLLLCSILPAPLMAQQQLTKIMGTVIDADTKDPIPFVNVYFAGTDIEATSDFDGRYSIETKTPGDSLKAQYIGYSSKVLPIVRNKFQYIDFELVPLTYDLTEVVIKPGENPAEIILKKVIENKVHNNKEAFDYFQYEAYSKIQIDANNFTDKLQNRAIMKPFKFIFENVDTSVVNGKAYLPVFLTETVSDIYFRGDPRTYREIIKASKISGIENASVSQLVGDSYQKINIYDNYLEFFQKNFISPIANFGLSYYKYYLLDSSYIGKDWCYHIMFQPRRSQELTFTGNFWVQDSNWAIRKVDMRMTGDANINLINDLVVYQEFDKIDSIHIMPVKDNMIADLNIIENNAKIFGFYVHRSASYKNFVIDSPMEVGFYDNPIEIAVADSALNLNDQDWHSMRPDSLSPEEIKIYHLADTIQTIRAFKIYKKVFMMVTTRHLVIGDIEIGPIFSIYSYNQIEGSRIRIGGRSSNDFSKNLMISAHLAYGTRDQKYKYGANIWWLFNKNPHRGVGAAYKYDLEQLGRSAYSASEDDIIGSVARRNPFNKINMAEEVRFWADYEWFIGFSTAGYLIYRDVYPIGNSGFLFYEKGRLIERTLLSTAELRLDIHLAIKEKFVSGEFERVSLGTKLPTLNIGYTHGFKDFFGSQYKYHKLQIGLSHWYNVGLLGWSKYKIELGKVWGRVPFPLLKLHEGNETYFWDEYAFSTMNYYEFMSDEYASIYFTHHFDGLLFNHIPLIKKLRWREVGYFRYAIGNISDINKGYNILPENTSTLNKPFYEAGFGIENIFSVLRVTATWRLSHLDHPDITRFTIMASYHFSF